VIQVSLEESRKHQAPQQDEQPKNVPQENKEVTNTYEEEEDPEKVEIYKDSEEAKHNDE
jgi:hypothetical protein